MCNILLLLFGVAFLFVKDETTHDGLFEAVQELFSPSRDSEVDIRYPVTNHICKCKPPPYTA
jgi:hypothetical protein